MDYVNKFNHLSQYARTHIDMERRRGTISIVASLTVYRRSCTQKTIRLLVFMMNAAITMEGLQRDSQAEWKLKRVITRSSSHPQAQKVHVVGGCPINL